MKNILKERNLTNHPDDHYLKVVLAKVGAEFVTWIKNTYDNGFYSGHYFDCIEDATKDYYSRK